MNKIDFMAILQASIFAFEGLSEEDIEAIFIKEKLNIHLVNSGIKLCNYLKSIKSPEEKIKQEVAA